MLNIVLVTPVYAECGRNAGVFTLALAKLIAEIGHRVHVICSHADRAMPGHEELGRISVQRLATKRANLKASFAALAVQYVNELARSERCDAIIDVDAEPFGTMLRSLISWRIPHHSVRADAISSRTQLPLIPGVWSPPESRGKTLLALETSQHERRILIEGFRSSNAMRSGWSLKALEHDGTWTLIEQSSSSSGQQDDTVLLPMRPGYSIAAHLGLAFGMQSPDAGVRLATALQVEDAINDLISKPRTDRRRQSSALWESSQTDAERNARHAFWSQMLQTIAGSAPDTQIKLWRAFEGTDHGALVAGSFA